MCIRIYIINYIKKKRQKTEETKEEKRISVENLTGYNDIVCEFALCTFNLLDRAANFSWLLYEFNVVYLRPEKYSICYTTTTYEVHAFKNKNKRKLFRDIFVDHFLFYTCLFVAENLP